MRRVLPIAAVLACLITAAPAAAAAKLELAVQDDAVLLNRVYGDDQLAFDRAVEMGFLQDAEYAPSSGGRVHRHVGWDELAPAGRRQAHATRHAPAPAQTGPVGDVTLPSDG